MTTTQTRWHITGDYFENCNCNVVCPCGMSPNPPMTTRPTEGFCDDAFAFHINSGSYGSTVLDGLNAVTVVHMPGAMVEGNWSVALYLDERANEQQRLALQAIFSGAAGGPMGAMTPLISNLLGAKAVPITYRIEGKRRSVEIPDIMHMAVQPIPSFDPNKEIWVQNAHPFAPNVALAIGEQNSTWADYGLRWDNSGRNGHYAIINWSNA
ncbi:MAG TPA: DUF1326 domain-containing protein [Ktedonobacteraceae bacterium]|nr:DUF1326 domain-containing protein [Ktedonobacteraceae bacterium]